MKGQSRSSTKLSDGSEEPFLGREAFATLAVDEALGEGASAWVGLVRLADGRRAVLKVAWAGLEETLLGEAHVLSVCDGYFAPRLLGLGRPSAEQVDRVRAASHSGAVEHQVGALGLLLEYIPGCPLSDLIGARAEGDVRLAERILVQGARALTHLHALGIAHGDIKPAHFVVAPDTSEPVRLIDFGLAGSLSTIKGGTPHYLPPEAWEGREVSRQAADVYGLGLTVCEILLPTLGRGTRMTPEDLNRLPAPFATILSPIVAPATGVRPNAAWLLSESSRRLTVEEDASEAQVAAIRQAYVTTRLADVSSLVAEARDLPEGLPGEWMSRVSVRLREIARLGREFGEGGLGPRDATPSPSRSGDLSAHDRLRFLGRLFGPGAVSWRLPACTDAVLVGALVSLCENRPLLSLVQEDVRAALVGETPESAEASLPVTEEERVVSWALELARRPLEMRTLRAIADARDVPPALRVRTAGAARLMGDSILCARLLQGLSSPKALLEMALLELRTGNTREAMELAERVEQSTTEVDVVAHAKALRARHALDGGDPEGGLRLLSDAGRTARSEEVRALCLLALGQIEGARDALDRGDTLARTEEEAARLWGVRGMVEHREGDALAARRSFEHAADLASRAGAALEEATYLTGISAAASDSGHLGVALFASERAACMFDALGHGGRAARAVLSRAAVLATLGAAEELESAVRTGLVLARGAEDDVCEAYLHLCLCDGTNDVELAQRSAERAAQLLEGGTVGDRLRAAARLLLVGATPPRDATLWAEECQEHEARVDFLRARAEALLRASSHASTDATRSAAREVVSQLSSLSDGARSQSALGPALVAGAHLALRATMADEARSLLGRARNLAEAFLEQVPPAYQGHARGLLWVQQARGSQLAEGAGHAQLADVESLLRTLSQRRGFRAMLDQVLDLLLFWTKVERGLLLLRAPGDRLVVRTARNLDKKELGVEQRNLSYSMAERALREGKPVVLVDAVHDVSRLHQSVHALNLRSVLAVPLAARGEVLGVAYLDDRVRRGAFGEKELAWVSLIGTIAALAIADEFDRLKLQRALRRARRDEKNLATQLVTREAQLEVAERELSRMREGHSFRGDYEQIVGRSPAMLALLELVDRVAQSDVPVLIQGESGTGKELIARAVTSTGKRSAEPFIAENCAAVPEGLLESALFGHNKGAFTGATRNQPGLFELAHRGTLFLDEIGDMSLPMQTRLLRVLQEGEVRPLGSDRTRRVDVRVIVATHRDLKELVDEGKFREDLYYRLNVVTLALPPLRERSEDIPALVRFFVDKYAGGEPRRLSSAAAAMLSGFSWPGNVRQLENEVRRMLVLGGAEITSADLSPEVQAAGASHTQGTTLREKVDALERRLVIEALQKEKGNRTRAAEVLGLSRFGLQKMTQRLGIDLSKSAQKSGRIRDRGLDDSR